MRFGTDFVRQVALPDGRCGVRLLASQAMRTKPANADLDHVRQYFCQTLRFQMRSISVLTFLKTVVDCRRIAANDLLVQ